MPPSKHKKPHRHHRSTLSLQKTEIIINVYDLLPPGRWSSVLWHLGASLLHSGVVVNGKEYAYGGHEHRGVTGVYWTPPHTVPPGGTFRCEILQGFTLATPDEIDAIINTASADFLGPSYNLLTKNCNHFTAYLCRKLTGRPGPSWLNRAASIGLALPCIVPREWIDPPDHVTAEGDLVGGGGGGNDGNSNDSVNRSNNSNNNNDAYHDPRRDDDDEDDDEDDDDASGERTSMLRGPSSRQKHLVGVDDDNNNGRPRALHSPWSSSHQRQPSEPFDEGDEETGEGQAKGKGRPGIVRDAAGHALPPSERVTA